MSKTLIVGDIHLGKGQNIGRPGVGSIYNSRIADQKRLLDWILTTALENHVDRLILTGDIFEDAKPDYLLVQLLIDWLKDFELENIDIHIIAGNHEIRRTGSIYTSALDIISSCDLSNVFVYKNITTIHTPGAGFTLVPYRDRRGLNVSTISEAIQTIDNCLYYESSSISSLDSKVLVGHLTLEGAIYVDEIDDLMNEIMCPLNMFSMYNYVWMGHVHKPQVRSKHPHIAHIGSLDISDFNESDQQKILILFDSQADDKFKTINIPSRPLRKLRISVPEDQNATEFVLSEIKNHHSYYSYKNALVRLDIILNSLDSDVIDRKKIEDYIYSLDAFYISNISETKNVTVVSSEKKDIVNNTIEPKSAVKLYSNTIKFNNESDQDMFVQISNEIIEEVDAGLK